MISFASFEAITSVRRRWRQILMFNLGGIVRAEKFNFRFRPKEISNFESFPPLKYCSKMADIFLLSNIKGLDYSLVNLPFPNNSRIRPTLSKLLSFEVNFANFALAAMGILSSCQSYAYFQPEDSGFNSDSTNNPAKPGVISGLLIAFSSENSSLDSHCTDCILLGWGTIP